MRVNKKHVFIAIPLLATIITLTIYFSLRNLSQQITVESAQGLVDKFGAAAPIVFILVCSATNIFSPLVITPFWIAGLLLFKLPWAFIYIYLANLLGHSLNFYIAKRWGRKLIVKFTGPQGLQKIDQFADVVGLKTVFFIRLFGGAATDYISYALGLTNLKFVPYFLITAVAFLPWIVLNFYLIQGALQGEMTVLVRNFGAIVILSYLLTLIVPFIIYRTKKKSAPSPL